MIDERIPSLDILNQPILEMYLNSFFSCKGLDNIFSCSVGVGNFVGSIGDMKIEEDCPTACRPTDHQAQDKNQTEEKAKVAASVWERELNSALAPG